MKVLIYYPPNKLGMSDFRKDVSWPLRIKETKTIGGVTYTAGQVLGETVDGVKFGYISTDVNYQEQQDELTDSGLNFNWNRLKYTDSVKGTYKAHLTYSVNSSANWLFGASHFIVNVVVA